MLTADFLLQEVKKNLHIVLSFSYVGEAFRERLRKFPSLVNCTTIDWFTAWPDDALHTVAQQVRVNFELVRPSEKVPVICETN